MTRSFDRPFPHPGGATPPPVPRELVPNHVAVVMDGNGRWANRQGKSRIEGHKAGEWQLIEVMAGAIEIGVKHLSAYAFSTENWRRSPEEVRFLMGFNRDTIARRVDLFDSWGVRVRWVGRKPRLWRSVYNTLMEAQERTKDNDVITLHMCVNYGGRLELVDAMRAMGEDVRAGRLNPRRIGEDTIAQYLEDPTMPDVDLFIRSSGEHRTSNFLLWQSAYAELVFDDTLWPEFDRTNLWRAIDSYARRDRRYGGAVDTPDAAEVTAPTEPDPAIPAEDEDAFPDDADA